MVLDMFTRVNLELTGTIRGNKKKGSLLHVLDKTSTAMGGRLLRKYVEEPLVNKSKIDESIKLYKEDLMSEQNWQSALALMTIYLYPEEFGAKIEPDLVKTLAYAYVSSDLRDGRHENDFNGVDTRFIEAMEQELPAETLKQAKSLYKEIKSEMNKVRVTDSDDIASLK